MIEVSEELSISSENIVLKEYDSLTFRYAEESKVVYWRTCCQFSINVCIWERNYTGKQYSHAPLILVIMQSEILLPKQSEKDHLVFGFKFPFYSKKCLNVFHMVNWQSHSNTFFFQNSSYFCLWAVRKSSFAKFLYIWIKLSSLFYAVQERRVATINISIFQGSINQVFCHLYSSKMTIRWLWVPWNRVIRIYSCESQKKSVVCRTRLLPEEVREVTAFPRFFPFLDGEKTSPVLWRISSVRSTVINALVFSEIMIICLLYTH